MHKIKFIHGLPVRSIFLLAVFLLFIHSCVTIEADPNKVNPSLFRIMANLFVLFAIVYLIAVILLGISLFKNEWPLLYNQFFISPFKRIFRK